MEKRTILAIALSILVFVGFQYYQQRYLGKTIGKRPIQQAQLQQEKTATEPVQETRPVAAEAALEPSGVSAGNTSASAQTLVVASDLYRAVIDNRGAVLAS